MSRIISIAALVLAIAGCASAQSPARFDPLRPLGPVFRCRVMPAPSGEWAGIYKIGFHFEEGEEMVDDRVIEAAYDSLGVPVILVITATEPHRQPVTMHAMTIRFAKGAGAGFRTVIQEAGGTSSGLGSPTTLSAEMVNQGRSLAQWLWARRCDGTKPASTSN